MAQKIEPTGDIPSPRFGHTMVYGNILDIELISQQG